VSALAFFCLIVSLTMKDTKATSRLDRDEVAGAVAGPAV
jgi:hypothetical protein